MGMKPSMTCIWSILSAMLAGMLMLALAGCSSAPGTMTGYSGSGADGGPWPQAPNRNTANQQTANGETPTASLLITLRGKAPEDRELLLDVTRVELKAGDRWLTVAGKADIEKIEKLPLRLGAKGGTALLAMTRIPRQKYSHLRLILADEKTTLSGDTEKLPLTVQNPLLELGDWTMSEKANNGLIINLDGTKITRANDSATLPAGGISLQAAVPAGGISGKIAPPLPTAKVEAYWGSTNVRVADAIPAAGDGAFALPNLPAGAYRVEVRAAGHHLIEPLKELVKIENAVVQLPNLELAADAPTQ